MLEVPPQGASGALHYISTCVSLQSDGDIFRNVYSLSAEDGLSFSRKMDKAYLHIFKLTDFLYGVFMR